MGTAAQRTGFFDQTGASGVVTDESWMIRLGDCRMWAFITGLGLGATFDALMMHRLLRWQLGLSGRSAGVFWQGLLDAAAVVLLLSGLTGLWVSKMGDVSRRVLTGAGLMGFGLWHAVDAGLLPGLHGLHDMGPHLPMLWQSAWVIVFGLMPILIARSLLSVEPDAAE
jgi:uncharacterized membrane protein